MGGTSPLPEVVVQEPLLAAGARVTEPDGIWMGGGGKQAAVGRQTQVVDLARRAVVRLLVSRMRVPFRPRQVLGYPKLKLQLARSQIPDPDLLLKVRAIVDNFSRRSRSSTRR